MPPARDLHAKLYVADDGWNAHLWTGSANATDAAFGENENVEFLVQLTGKKARSESRQFSMGRGGGLGGSLRPSRLP